VTSPTSDTASASLFDHALRKEWGVGILAWEDGGKRGYLFEDGEERTLASGFHQLMRKVEKPSAEQLAASERLRRKLAAREQAQPSGSGPKFLDQLSRLHETYGAGLLDPKWVADIRGEGAEQRLPGHRAPSILEAQEQLSKTALDALLSSHSYGQLWELVITSLSRTDLVPAIQLKKPKLADQEQQRGLAVAVRELLHGAGAYEPRFDRYVAALATLGEPPRWEMATALSALVHPAQHVCVHPVAFRLQLKATGSRGTSPARPSSAAYNRMLAVTRFVSSKLIEQSQPPRDLLDVYDFVRVTLAPPAKPAKRRAVALL
jgi:hypothetical protein